MSQPTQPKFSKIDILPLNVWLTLAPEKVKMATMNTSNF